MDHRVVFIIKHKKLLFKQISAKSIRPDMGCKVILIRQSEREKATWWHRLWRTIFLEQKKFLLTIHN